MEKKNLTNVIVVFLNNRQFSVVAFTIILHLVNAKHGKDIIKKTTSAGLARQVNKRHRNASYLLEVALLAQIPSVMSCRPNPAATVYTLKM